MRTRESWFDKRIMEARADITRYWLGSISKEREEVEKEKNELRSLIRILKKDLELNA